MTSVRLAVEAEIDGYRLRTLGETGSTNDDAVAAFRDGDPGRLWVVAERQVVGRGRHGRAWASPTGNLYASLLLVEPCAIGDAAQLGFLAGLALHDAVSDIAGRDERLRLKWPNDLLWQGAKLAGMLLEGHRDSTGRFGLVIGIGTNVAHKPEGTPYPAAKVTDIAPGADRVILFEALSRAMARRIAAWEARASDTAGLASLRAEWLTRAAGLGESASVRLPAGPREGRFEGLDAHGRLRLLTTDGLLTVDAGDLYFPDLLADDGVRHSNS